MQISRKQKIALDFLDDPQIIDILYGGGAGGGKSLLVCLWAVIQCNEYPEIRIGLGRNEISNLRKTTVQTLLREAHKILEVDKNDFIYRPILDPGIYYSNGSQIIFVDLAYEPSDPDFDRLGSLNLTHTIIEEMGEVMKKARDVFTSRKNRCMNKHYKIIGKSIGTCNPSRNFLRQEYYDFFIKNGGGSHQSWPIINDSGESVFVTLSSGKKVIAKRAFIKSLAIDNPFLSDNYISELKTKPLVERKRLLDGDWDYYHDAATIFKRSNFIIKEAEKESTNYGGCDPSRGGDDCVFTFLKGGNVRDIEKIFIPSGEIDIGSYVASRFIKFCELRHIGSNNAAVDIVGIGESVGDSCNRLGFKIQRFNAGSKMGIRRLDDSKQYGFVEINKSGIKGIPIFDNIRSQNFYDMAEAINIGELTFSPNLPYYEELCSQLEAHGCENKEKMIIIEKKDQIKKKIGKSPDIADSLQAAWWVSKRKQYAMKDMVLI